ncbi:MAG: glutamyl-tRNA reductase [Melioribacteraceae bacterium]|nr:glutamyl-tRNA reductase [Melioribacteraceae bacterium]MCF8264507.1 glutamyl-tRNA reductase [Melioribacteraceae bacterium]MCF8412473.1 glutamyl-tRNA reductase [Melioribacteraceae bacterium]MCF8432035.1 glutamyl-tRNA reductase [Melioribacteraceae bacterium]
MNLIGVSLNHKSANIDIREALHLSKNEILELIPILKRDLFSEGLVLSTCNRTEIFGFPKDVGISYKDIQKTLIEYKPVPGLNSGNFINYFSCSAVKHIFNVACGIDSLIIGDSQILGQVKESIQLSDDLNFSGNVSKRLFDQVLRVGKRAIKETLIGEGAVTVSYAAVQIIEKIFANLNRRSALVIGAGETGELAAIHLRDKEIGKLSITNRSFDKAKIVAEKLRADIVGFEDYKERLHEFDIVVSATSSPAFLLTKDDIKSVMKKRRRAPIVLMDIALPRDIDPQTGNIDNVFYNDIDSLNVIVEENLQKRKEEIPLVNDIIMEEMVAFFSWFNSLRVVPTIKSFRSFFEEITQDELRKIRHKVTDEDFQKLENMTRRLIGRLMHNPTKKLKEIAENGIETQEVSNTTAMLIDLFDLNNPSKDEYTEEREN